MDGQRDGRRDRYLYIIDCLRQEVAFAPKIINRVYLEYRMGGGESAGL